MARFSAKAIPVPTAMLWAAGAPAQTPHIRTSGPQTYGPIDADLPAGGEAVRQAIGGDNAAPIAATRWTLSAWIEPRGLPSNPPRGLVRVAGFGGDSGARRFLAFRDGRPALVTEAGTLVAPQRLASGGWHLIAATGDGRTVRLYVDGRQGAARALGSAPVSPIATLAPRGRNVAPATQVVP